MKKAQLSLYADLNLDQAMDSVPSRSRRKFTGTTNPRHWMPILALLRNPLPLQQLQRIGKADDGAELAEELRQLGLELPCHQVPEVNAAGEVIYREVVALTLGDIRLINRWFARRGGQ